jgi:adenine-specific DNA-methyltransferase
MAELDAQGRLWYPDSKEKRPRLKRYLDESRGVPLSSLWTDIRPINSQAKEDTAYDTQKPEALLERIIAASSEPGSLVLDFFCGAGTTLAVAERLGRRWIGCDLGRQAVQTSRKRLLESGARQFEILGLGAHERKYWQAAMFGDLAVDTAYVRFVLDLYGAEAIEGLHLHGRKGQALVRVGAVDSPVTDAQVEAAVAEANEQGVQEVHVLGWEWDLSLRHRADVRFFVIPREIMQSRAVERGDIRFFERARVQLEAVAAGPDGPVRAPCEASPVLAGGVRLHLRNFILPSVEPPVGDPRKGHPWSDSIDGWAVDWDFRGDRFTSRWQAYRTRRNRELKLETPVYTYAVRGRHQILVKVTDIFGNDTHHLVCWEAK